MALYYLPIPKQQFLGDSFDFIVTKNKDAEIQKIKLKM